MHGACRFVYAHGQTLQHPFAACQDGLQVRILLHADWIFKRQQLCKRKTAPCCRPLHDKHIPQPTVYTTQGECWVMNTAPCLFWYLLLHLFHVYSNLLIMCTATSWKAILCRCAGVVHLSSPKISSKGAYVRWSKSLPGQQVCVLAVCYIFLSENRGSSCRLLAFLQGHLL